MNVPTPSRALAVLLRSDLRVQWRNRRSVVLVFLVPVLILMAWKDLIPKLGAAFVLATCITIGLTAIGLMGYSNQVARDRDRGVFQRLRVAPVPSWAIMLSRLIVQLLMIVLLTLIIFTVANNNGKIHLQAAAYPLALVAAVVGGAVYLGIGQLIAGLLKNAESVNAMTRLVYFIFIMIGMFGEMGTLGNDIRQVVHWSPYGTVRTMIAAALTPGHFSQDALLCIVVSIGYAFALSFAGIRLFKWK